MGRGLAPALAGIVIGTALQLQQASLWVPAAYGVIAAAGALLLFPRKAGTAFLAAAGLAFALAGLRAAAFDAQRLDPAVEGKDVVVMGVVAAMPQRNESGLRFAFDVEASAARLPPRIMLGWWGPAAAEKSSEIVPSRGVPDLKPGERWRFTVRLKAPHGNVNPHGFDHELWMWEQGLQATGSVRSGPRDPAPQRVAATWMHPVERARQAVRDAIFARVEDRQTAGVIAALVTGDQAAIERSQWDVFRATGVAHLMSISGLHITMFAWAASLLVGALWRRSARLCLAIPSPHAALAGGVALAVAYAVFSGWGVPAQRTVVMLAVVALLRLGGLVWPWPHVWLLACAAVLLADPWAMLQAGFWLSFVAVGVLFATDSGAKDIEARASLRHRLMHTARGALREQWVVTLALTPLTLLLFGQMSVVGLLANALAIPWVTLVVTPLALAGVAWPLSWDASAVAMQFLQAALQWLAALPFATVSWPAAPFWAGALAVLGGCMLAMRLPWGVRALGVPLVLPLLLWQAPRPPAGEFEVLAADVGQGNALLVRTASHTLVYDAGPRYGPESDAGHRVMVPLLRALDESVDTVMLSHRDIDHTGGAAAVLAMQRDAALVSSLEEAHELLGLRRHSRCLAGMSWERDGVTFRVVHPRPEDFVAGAKPNSISCVLRVSNGRRTALLAGDLEAPQEGRLVGGAERIDADLLLVPHHGSKTSSTGAFLDAVHPAFAIVQAGYRNRFGHPAAPVVDRYRERGIEVIDSAHCGAARWRSDEPGRLECEREQAPRYWQPSVPGPGRGAKP